MVRNKPVYVNPVLFLLLTLLFVACNQPGSTAGKNKRQGITCNDPVKITAIYKDYVYDLPAYEDVVGGSGFALFDENAFVDPRSQVDDYTPLTNPHPRSSMVNYFKVRGNRIVVDLQVPYKMSEIYLYDASRAMDTVWIYTGTMQNWKLSGSFVTNDDPGQWGWRKFKIGRAHV